MTKEQILKLVLFSVMLPAVEGRAQRSLLRDPFQTLSPPAGKVSKETTKHLSGRPPGFGLSTIRIEDARLVGIISEKESWFALLTAKDHTTYIALPGSRLLDGQVRDISASGIRFSRTPIGTEKSEIIFKPFGEGKRR